jgi:hypothetical protein
MTLLWRGKQGDLVTDWGATSGGKLPVWRAVRAAFAALYQERSTLARAASTWLAITTPLMFALNWLLWPYQPTVRTEAASSLANILFDTSSVWIFLLELLPESSIAVAWHRRLLLEESVKTWSYFRLDRLVGIFALTNLLIALPAH